jgi:outer membrane receptor protein involved in Fe transport
VPVSPDDSNTVSTLNLEDSYTDEIFVNKGKGRNYGIELSLEKYLSNRFYFMFSNSLYQSKYTAVDGIERNTRFNGNYISNLVAGKEFIFAEGKRTLGINIKTVYAGGYRATPIDVEQSQLLGYTVYKDKEAYSLQNPAYMRADMRISMKWNKKHVTSTLSLDIQNLTGRQNISGSYYDATENKIVTTYQTGLIPVLNYIVEF